MHIFSTFYFFLPLSSIPGKSQALLNLTLLTLPWTWEDEPGSGAGRKNHNYEDCFFFKFLSTDVLPSICLWILFPCSFHSISSEMTFYTFCLILNLEHFLPSSHSQLMTFLLIAFEKIATLQKDFPTTSTINSTYLHPNPLLSFLSEWENPLRAHLSQPLHLFMRSHPLRSKQELCFCNYPWSLFKHLLQPCPSLFCNSSHSRERNALFPPLIVAVLIFLLFAKQNLEKRSLLSLSSRLSLSLDQAYFNRLLT